MRLIERPGKARSSTSPWTRAAASSTGPRWPRATTPSRAASGAPTWTAAACSRLVSGLTVYGAEALQIAVDPVGNKLYWTKGHELWWANLDGSAAQVVYTIDRAVPGVSQIGDVVVDGANGRLYLSERRLRGTLAGYNAAQAGNVTYIPFHGRKHTVIVAADLNGANARVLCRGRAGLHLRQLLRQPGHRHRPGPQDRPPV